MTAAQTIRPPRRCVIIAGVFGPAGVTDQNLPVYRGRPRLPRTYTTFRDETEQAHRACPTLVSPLTALSLYVA